MNRILFPQDVNAEFKYNYQEIHKSDEDIKIISFNEDGTILIIVTKANNLKIFDFLSKNIIFTTNYFSETKRKITSICWLNNSEYFFVTYEKDRSTVTGYQKVAINLYDKNYPPFQIILNNEKIIS